MRLTHFDISNARMWAEQHHGEDDVMDVFEHKLLEIIAKSHESNAGYHERQREKCQAMMSEIESKFIVSGDAEF